jgi:hypothetical protein
MLDDIPGSMLGYRMGPGRDRKCSADACHPRDLAVGGEVDSG